MRKDFYGDAGVWDGITTVVPPIIGVGVMLGAGFVSAPALPTPVVAAAVAIPAGIASTYGIGKLFEKLRQNAADKNLEAKAEEISKNEKALVIDVTPFKNEKNRLWNEYNGSLMLENIQDDYKIKLAVETYYPMKELHYYGSNKTMLLTNANDVKAYLYLESKDEKFVEPLAEVKYDWDINGFPKEKFSEMLKAVETADAEMIESYRKASDRPTDVPQFIIGDWRKVVKDIVKSTVVSKEEEQTILPNPFDLKPEYQEKKKEKKM